MKVIYINKKTGREVHYGDMLTYDETRLLDNGYKIKSTTTLPIINETIPSLIKKGILVQKEIEVREDAPKKEMKQPENKESDYTVEEKLDMLLDGFFLLLDNIRKIEHDLYEK